MPIEKHEVADQFVQRFGEPPRWVVRAPGRVNLIGEHTDYNDGFVLPMAIDRAVWIALRPRDDRRVMLHSVDFSGQDEFALDELTGQDGRLNNEGEGWVEYVKAVAWSLGEAGHDLAGWEGVVQGDVPVGAGLSSSAALEVATARAFAAVAGIEWDPAAMARLAQRAENAWVGVNCGIMDQLISAAGQAGHALLIDCRSLETRPVPFPPGVTVVILDTATRRGLVDSAYNERRAQCEEAARFFRKGALRDVGLELFEQLAVQLEEPARSRAQHVITENVRTIEAVEALRRGELCGLGVLMRKSHASLRDDYEVSSDALDAMVASAMGHRSCYGARMTGAGFGGCAVAIVETDAAEEFVNTVAFDYEKKTGNRPAVYVCRPANGAEVFAEGE
ncbi:MAG: galactokinase [Planctomycetota bacterium]|jgi:galactokinase